MKAIDFLNELRSTTSINEKKEILEKYKNNILIKTILKFTYDSSIVFGIKKIPEPEKEGSGELIIALKRIHDELHKNELRGNKAVKLVKEILENLDKKDQEVLKLILKKDLKCGINKKLIKQIIPEIFDEIGYMGAVPYDPKKLDKIIQKNRYIFSQKKMDGEYSNCVIKIKPNNYISVQFFSRENKRQLIPEKIIKKIQDDIKDIIQNYIYPDKIIFNGELIIEGYDRYTANGLLTRLFKIEDYKQKYLKERTDKNKRKLEKAIEKIEEIAKCKYENLIDKIKYYIWDFIDDELLYIQRFISLVGKYNFLPNNDFFKIVDTRFYINENNKDTEYDTDVILENLGKFLWKRTSNINEIKEAILNHFKEEIANGQEGIIVKAGGEKWKDGKPTYQLKLKAEFECELKVKDILPGDPGNKFENTTGRILFESEDGLVQVKVSGGISEEERDEIWQNKEKYIGKIATIKGNFLSYNKDTETYSIGHPRKTKWREDKIKADTLPEIQEIINGLLKI